MRIDGSGQIGPNISDAIRAGARATGANFDYLLKTAQRESSFNPAAKAATSTATGLFQFIEQTWLQTLKNAGPALGYGEVAAKIERTPSGRYVVSDPAERRAIMDLRKDPAAASVMAGAFTRSNAAYLRNTLGREPNDGELYIAHFLGPSGAARLISAAEHEPRASAAELFPSAAGANRTIFYRRGAARSARQVYNLLVSKHTATPVPRVPVPRVPVPAQPAGTMAVASAAEAARVPMPRHMPRPGEIAAAAAASVAAFSTNAGATPAGATSANGAAIRMAEAAPVPPAPIPSAPTATRRAEAALIAAQARPDATGQGSPSMLAPLTPSAMVAARWPGAAPSLPAGPSFAPRTPEAVPFPGAPAPSQADPATALAFAGDTAIPSSPAAAASTGAVAAGAATPVFHSLFRTADVRPVSAFVSDLWAAKTVHDPERIGAAARGAAPAPERPAGNTAAPAGEPLELFQFLRPEQARRGRNAA